AAATVRPPWWRRLLRRLAGRSSYQAGQRRERRARPVLARAVRLVALVAVLAVAVAFGPGAVRWAVNEVRDRTQDHVPLSPSGFRASSARPGAPAERIADGASNRYWAPTGSGENAWVEASFAQPVRLLDVVVTAGISPQQDQFLTAGRPRTLEVSAERASGAGVTFVVELRDAPGPQAFTVEAEGVVRVRLTVRSSYGPAAARGIAVAEVEFFGRL
ncbi:MAG TPA: hypothetical protein VNV66_22080, partial [Pilimelia sp.]|nr:hypothetical protein [Pilimelia sp.]